MSRRSKANAIPPQHRRRSGLRRGGQNLALVGLAIGALLVSTPGPADAHTGPRTGTRVAVVSSAGSGPLTLQAQTPWVAPGQAFDLRLRVSDVATPATQLGVSVAVYPCLTSVSAFDQSLSGPSGTPISSTRTPLAVGGLPVVDGGVDLSMPVVVGRAPGAAVSTAFTIDLTNSGDLCGAYPSGVYPMRVQLVDMATKQVVGSITTHLVYAEPGTDTQRLRVAVVLPVQATLSPSRAPTSAELLSHPSSALDAPSPLATATVTAMVSALGEDSTIPVTLEASPQTVADLAASGHGSTVDQLATLAATPSIHQFTAAPFVPLDASSLVDAGLGGELALQVGRGTQVLDTTVTRSTAANGTPGLGPWITNDPVDTDTLTQLESAGYTHLVLPTGSVSSSPTNGSAAEPFQVPSAHGSPVAAVTADADLASRFSAAPGNAVLAAHQLIAELAQIYYEKPNDTTPRAVVAMAPKGWSASPSFVGALLGALNGNPIIQPVTTTGLFDAFDTTASCRVGCRLLPVTTVSGLPVAAIRTQRRRTDGFSSAAPSAHGVSGQLADLVLASESETLRPSQQSAVLRNTAAAVDAQLAQVQVAGDRTITLTSQQGTLPVTVVSSADYPVTAQLTLTSDKLLFPNGTTLWTQPVTLQLPNNTVYVKVRARASGVFKVGIVLHSPAYGLVLSSGEVDVRSTATSVVGVVLSLGAVAVLVVWWLRTSRRRRHLRDKDEFEAPGASAEPR